MYALQMTKFTIPTFIRAANVLRLSGYHTKTLDVAVKMQNTAPSFRCVANKFPTMIWMQLTGTRRRIRVRI